MFFCCATFLHFFSITHWEETQEPLTIEYGAAVDTIEYDVIVSDQLGAMADGQDRTGVRITTRDGTRTQFSASLPPFDWVHWIEHNAAQFFASLSRSPISYFSYR